MHACEHLWSAACSLIDKASVHAAGLPQILDRAMDAILRSQQGNKNVLCYGQRKVPPVASFASCCRALLCIQHAIARTSQSCFSHAAREPQHGPATSSAFMQTSACM